MANDNSPEKGVDEETGTAFVGHEWDGIRELDTPMPRWWVVTLYATIIWGVIYLILYPGWPLLTKGTEGLLGWTSRSAYAKEVHDADLAQAAFRRQLSKVPIEQLPENKDLMRRAVAGGAAAFKVNCVQCHGAGAGGNQTLGYPNLNDDDWLWGGDLPAIQYTITNGVRVKNHELTRTTTMPAFADVFTPAQMDGLIDHVLSFRGEAQSNEVGATLYTDNCVTCHGENGEGDRSQGSPKLSDAIWLYGSSRTTIAEQIQRPHMGVMPNWGERLDAVTIKMLAAYVHSLGGGEELSSEDLAKAPTTNPVATTDEQP